VDVAGEEVVFCLTQADDMSALNKRRAVIPTKSLTFNFLPPQTACRISKFTPILLRKRYVTMKKKGD
jgi:hypothetical protein